MTMFAKILTSTAGLAIAAVTAAPAVAQPAPYGGYNQGYNTGGGGVGAIISQILGGGRYGAQGQGNDRVAVDQCARAAEARVSQSSRARGYGNYQHGYANQGYPNQAYGHQMRHARVIGITGVERRSNGLRVSGVMDSGRSQYRGAYPNQGYNYGAQGYANQGYPNQGYSNQGYGNAYAYGQNAQVADLRFSCRVDFRGYVTSLDVRRNVARRGF
ncbi:hypothetical protein [Sphingomonas sp.]|uniref:hypothetical protein n=1 Tax=Sphingomonas sp. TaxID=28214 RepID=UPI00179BCF4F|nr:hypothetical protein [Sphingomonas sp.]MBA3512449.1 hypothetical protein [Sphingomonas sp.]